MTRQIGSPFGNKLGQLTPGLKMTQVSKQSTFFPAMVQLTATKQFTFEALTMKEMWSKGHFILFLDPEIFDALGANCYAVHDCDGDRLQQ